MMTRAYVRAAKAAEELGIDVELLQGLIDGKKIAGFRDKGKRVRSSGSSTLTSFVDSNWS